MRCLPRSRQSIDRQSRTDALMPMGITGKTASGPSGSEAFFFVLLGKSPLPKPLEHWAALLSVGVIVGIFDLFRQIVGDIQGFKSPKGAKFDWDAYKIWIKKVNNSKIAVLSRESISKWTKQYVAQRNPAADAARKTRTSCNTILRNAKALLMRSA